MHRDDIYDPETWNSKIVSRDYNLSFYIAWQDRRSYQIWPSSVKCIIPERWQNTRYWSFSFHWSVLFIVTPHNKKELLQTPPPAPEGFPTTRGTEDKPGQLIQAFIPAHDKLFYYREYGARLQNILMFITVLILVLQAKSNSRFLHSFAWR